MDDLNDRKWRKDYKIKEMDEGEIHNQKMDNGKTDEKTDMGKRKGIYIQTRVQLSEG